MRRALAIGLLGALTMTITSRAAAEIPAALRPRGIAGSSFNVRDVEAQKAWYLDKLGMKLIDTFNRDGKPFEYIVGYGGQGAILALLSAPNRPAGPNAMGRLILNAPDAKGLAEHLKTQGLAVREVIANIAYFIADPEGNPIELYTPPARK